MRGLPLIAALALGGCAGAVAGFMPGQTVRAGGDSFTVTIDGNHAVARNFATGVRNQDRLHANAQEAIHLASGCAIASFAQEPGVNTYRARLDCA